MFKEAPPIAKEPVFFVCDFVSCFPPPSLLRETRGGKSPPASPATRLGRVVVVARVQRRLPCHTAEVGAAARGAVNTGSAGGRGGRDRAGKALAVQQGAAAALAAAAVAAGGRRRCRCRRCRQGKRGVRQAAERLLHQPRDSFFFFFKKKGTERKGRGVPRFQNRDPCSLQRREREGERRRRNPCPPPIYTAGKKGGAQRAGISPASSSICLFCWTCCAVRSSSRSRVASSSSCS